MLWWNIPVLKAEGVHWQERRNVGYKTFIPLTLQCCPVSPVMKFCGEAVLEISQQGANKTESLNY